MCGSLPVISLMDVSTADLCGRSRISSPDLDPGYRYLFRGKVFFDVEMMKVRFPDLPITGSPDHVRSPNLDPCGQRKSVVSLFLLKLLPELRHLLLQFGDLCL
jgi:hypothetical protein